MIERECRLMETRFCPSSGRCKELCARFESDDPTPWLERKPMTGRNVFENNNSIAEEDVEVLGTGPHIPLPELKEGYDYEIQKLPSGRQAVVVTPRHKENTELERAFPEDITPNTCGCGKYQSCSVCRKYQGDALDSPESRTFRHKD